MGALYAMHHAVKLEYTAETDNRFQQCYEDWSEWRYAIIRTATTIDHRLLSFLPVNPRHLSKPPRTLDDQLSLGDKWYVFMQMMAQPCL